MNQTRRGRTTHSTFNTSRAHPRRHTAITHQHVAHGAPTGQKSSRHGMAWRRAKRSTEQSLAHSTRTPCINTSNPIVTVQDKHREIRGWNKIARPHGRAHQSTKHGNGKHGSQLVAEQYSTATPHQHGTQQGAQKLTAEQTSHGDFTARAEHGHTEQSLAHATVHEHKHPVETLLDQKRIAEHTRQSRAQDSSTVTSSHTAERN